MLEITALVLAIVASLVQIGSTAVPFLKTLKITPDSVAVCAVLKNKRANKHIKKN